MRVFGLTGGIASGKSTVARRVAELGVPVVYADELAREAVGKDTAALQEVVALLGQDVLDASGELDRKKAGARVFGDPARLRALNSIVHPRVGALAAARFAELAAAGHALACYEVPLLVESGLADALRPVVVVAAPEALQIARAVERDGLDAGAVEARVRAQLPLEKKLEVADYVIENTGTLDDLTRRTDEVVASIRALPG